MSSPSPALAVPAQADGLPVPRRYWAIAAIILAITMTVSLLASLLLALTWTPALSGLLLRDAVRATGAHHGHHYQGLMLGVINFYEKWLRRAIKKPAPLFVACALLILLK